MKTQQQCAFCSQSFSVMRQRSKYCSNPCYQKSRAQKVCRTCQLCGVVFLAHQRTVRKGYAKFCSRSCQNAYPRQLSAFCSRGHEFTKENTMTWKHRNKNERQCKTCAYQSNKERRIRHLLVLWEYLKEHPCVDCGEPNPFYLDFDHEKGTKTSPIARLRNTSYKIETIMNEVAKCTVRCVRCHRLKTAIEEGWYAGIPEIQPWIRR